MTARSPHDDTGAGSDPASGLGRLLVGLLLLGTLGTLAELLLLGHTEGYQLVPVVLLGLTPAVLVATRWNRGRAPLRLLQAWMLAFVVAGLAGIGLHFRGNVEFELEMYPSRSGVELVWEALHGATPALAPGTMVLLGLLGLVYCLSHPQP